MGKMSEPVKYCLSMDKWIEARRPVPQEENPDWDPRIHRKNVMAKREAVESYFPDFDIRLLVERMPLPDVLAGDKFIYGELFGCRVGDRGAVLSHPWENFDSVAQIEDFQFPDIESVPAYEGLLKEYRRRSANFNGAYDNRVLGFFFGQGGMAVFTTVNMAFRAMGSKFLESMVLDPPLAHAAVKKTIELQHVIDGLKEKVDGRPLDHCYLGECCNVMLSPRFYEEFSIPHLAETARRYGNVESHNCGAITHLLPVLPKIGTFKWMELGWGTDLTQVRKHLGDTHILARLGVTIMQQWPAEEVYRHVRGICEALAPGGPLTLHSNCIDPQNTSEATIRAVLQAVADHEAENAAA